MSPDSITFNLIILSNLMHRESLDSNQDLASKMGISEDEVVALKAKIDNGNGDLIEVYASYCSECAKNKCLSRYEIAPDGEQVCKCGYVAHSSAPRIKPMPYYRQPQNYAVWNKNLGLDPVLHYKVAQKVFAAKGIMISEYCLDRVEDKDERLLIGRLSSKATRCSFTAGEISHLAKLFRKFWRNFNKDRLEYGEKVVDNLIEKAVMAKRGSCSLDVKEASYMRFDFEGRIKREIEFLKENMRGTSNIDQVVKAVLNLHNTYRLSEDEIIMYLHLKEGIIEQG